MTQWYRWRLTQHERVLLAPVAGFLAGLYLEKEAIWRLADGTFFEFMTGGKLPGDTNCTANRRVIRASSGKERR